MGNSMILLILIHLVGFWEKSDCDARITEQRNLLEGGVSGGACEVINFFAGNGSETQLVYPIEPVLPLDDLNGNVKCDEREVGCEYWISCSLSLRQGSRHQECGRGDHLRCVLSGPR